MKKEEVEIKAVDTILDKGVRVPIPTPFLLRAIGIKKVSVVVRRPVMGTMLRISKRFVQLRVDKDLHEKEWQQWVEVFVKKMKPVSMIVAIGMLRGKWAGYLFARPLAWYLRWHLNTRELAEIAAMLVTLSGIQDFMNTITFLRGMKTTAPANVGQ
jgi:hypothetical protein